MNRPAVSTSAAIVVEGDLDHIVTEAAGELSRMSGATVLVTGGAGFLGYYIVQALLRWNREDRKSLDVTVCDNYARGMPSWLADLAGDPQLTLLEHDVTRPLPDSRPYDFIVHAAGIASPTLYRLRPIETMDANVLGLRNLLDRARSQDEKGHPTTGFLYFSSSEIYGDPAPDWIPTPETYRGNVSCTGPRACYDESKRFGETLCVNFARQYGVPATIVRPFNNYGPGLKISDRRVIPDLARDVLAGNDVRLLSDGRATRTFCYVADAVVAYFKVLVRGRPGEPYNVGVETPEISIAELARLMADTAARLFGYAGGVCHATSDDPDYLIDNPTRRCPDISKARAELDYGPDVTIREGLARSLVWYAEHRDSPNA